MFEKKFSVYHDEFDLTCFNTKVPKPDARVDIDLALKEFRSDVANIDFIYSNDAELSLEANWNILLNQRDWALFWSERHPNEGVRSRQARELHLLIAPFVGSQRKREEAGMLVPGLNILPIFPCKLNKSPLTPNGFYNAVVGADYSGWPRVGVATGAVSGIDVIDIDPDGMAWLEANRHRLPLTREHQTSRGRHLLLKHHPGMRNSNRRIAPGVDVRGDGGYVIWWPREGYPVIDAPHAEWPEWLLELTSTVDASVATVKGRTHKSLSHAYERNGVVEQAGNLRLRSRYILNKVERAKPGERNRLLFWGSCRHGEMIGEGRMKREEALLEGAAKFNGLWCDGETLEEQADVPRRVRATIRSGIETGIKQWKAMIGDRATMQGQHLHVQPLSVGTGFSARTAARTKAKT